MNGDQSSATSTIEGWTLHEYPVADSTNFVAAKLGAWQAVRADVQTAGRGRFQRQWVSDAGGLWLSANVPCDAKSIAGRILPLAVGSAVCRALAEWGIPNLRMRWPNDVLVQDRKLAGLLIDRFQEGVAVVGIGINVRNQPEARNQQLTGQTARLADLIARCPSLTELTMSILHHLRAAVEKLALGEFPAQLGGLNGLWGPPRMVELDLDGDLRRGTFSGVDAEGRLILEDAAGQTAKFAASQVRHLTELT